MHTVYDPCANVFNDGLCEDVQKIAENNAEYGAANNINHIIAHAAIGIANAENEFVIQNMIARQENWRDLSDTDEHGRLHAALMRVIG